MSSVTMNANLGKRSWFRRVPAYVAALLATAFFALPLVWLVLSSIKSDGDVAAYPPKLFFEPSFANYSKLFSELDAGKALYNSFFIVSIASNTRFASPPPAASASVSARGVICQERPQRSLHQQHSLSLPPLPTIAFQ